jgi:hypothetical protein
MIRCRHALAAASLLLSLGSLAVAQDMTAPIEPLTTIPAVVDAIDTTVFAVRVVSPWTDQDVQGFSRVILTAEGDTPRLYVQWVEEPADGEPNIRTTIEVPDVAKEKLVFGDIRIEASNGEASVFLDTRPDTQGIRESYVLIVSGPGSVRFGPATN